MTRVVWTASEKELVFKRLEQIFADHPVKSRKEAFTLAQSTALTPDRWTKITDQRVFNYKGQIEAAHRNGMAIRKKRDATREELVRQVAIPAPTPAPERKESTTERLAGIFEQLLDVLADKIADRLRPGMSREELLEHVDRQFEAEFTKYPRPRHDPQPVSQPRQGRPGVLILGLLNQSGEQVRREFGDRLDIAWMDTDDAGKKSPHPMAHIILMTKFINHSVQERWRKRAGVLHYCNGGVSELRQMLDKLSHG